MPHPEFFEHTITDSTSSVHTPVLSHNNVEKHSSQGKNIHT
jgi:hypothetical protein